MKNKQLRNSKGRFIKKQKFFKIVDPFGHRGMLYKEGINIDVLPFKPSGDCEPGGLYFASEDILAFLDYGSLVYEVEPIGEVYENPGMPKKFKAHSLNMKLIGNWLQEPHVLKYVIDNGGDVHNISEYVLYYKIINKEHYDILDIIIDEICHEAFLLEIMRYMLNFSTPSKKYDSIIAKIRKRLETIKTP